MPQEDELKFPRLISEAGLLGSRHAFSAGKGPLAESRLPKCLKTFFRISEHHRKCALKSRRLRQGNARKHGETRLWLQPARDLKQEQLDELLSRKWRLRKLPDGICLLIVLATPSETD